MGILKDLFDFGEGYSTPVQICENFRNKKHIHAEIHFAAFQEKNRYSNHHNFIVTNSPPS